MKTIVKIEMHPQNSCPLFSYPYACPHPSSTVFWNQNNPWFSYPYAISVLYSSTPMLSRGTRLGVQRYENIVDDGIMLLQSFKMWCNAFGFYHIPMTSRLPWITLLPFMIEVQKKNCGSSTDIIVHLIFLGAKIHLCSQDNGSLRSSTYISDRQKDTKKSPTRIGDVWMDNGNISKW